MMPHGVTTLLFVLLAGLLVAVARGQSDYYDQYLDTHVRILGKGADNQNGNLRWHLP